MRLQRLSIGLSFVCLLAVPLLAAAGPDPSAPSLRTGRLEIAFDPAELSSLPVDAEALRQSLCSGLPNDGHDWAPITPAGECELAVRSPPRLGFFVDAVRPFDGSVQASIQPTDLPAWEASTPVATACGLWDVSMGLDPEETQPVSRLTLEPSAEDSSQGVFAGEAHLAVRIRFVSREKGTTLELPAVVPLELAGHWASVPETGPGLGLDDTVSNLVLFAEAGATWSSVPGLATWGHRGCGVFAVPAPSVLETLNQIH